MAHDAGRAAAGDEAYGLLVDRTVAVTAAGPALRLADDLARHRDHVAVGQVGAVAEGGQDQPGEVVAGPDLGDPVGRPDLDPHAPSPVTRATAAAAMAAVASGSLIISGTARAGTPASSSRGSWSASRVSTSQPSSTPPEAREP